LKAGRYGTVPIAGTCHAKGLNFVDRAVIMYLFTRLYGEIRNASCKDIPQELGRVIEAWEHLPEAATASMIAIVECQTRPPHDCRWHGTRERNRTS